MDKALRAAEIWVPPTTGYSKLAKVCFLEGYRTAVGELTAPQPVRPIERIALTAVAYLIRDAARLARERGLQSDDEHLDRLIGLFNLPEAELIDAVARFIGGSSV